VYEHLESINNSSIELNIEHFLAQEGIRKVDPKEEIEQRYSNGRLENWVQDLGIKQESLSISNTDESES